jgi:hypothetical protein
MNRLNKLIKLPVWCLSTIALIALVFPASTQAGTKESMALFYGSIKLIQITALRGASDMWAALGSAAKAQECLGLANDLQKGDLANEDGMKKFVAASSELKEQLELLQEAGAPLSAEQMKRARAANLKIFGTTVLWAGAAITGYNVLTSNDLNFVEKAVLVIAVGNEVKKALGATKQLSAAFHSYSDLAKGGDSRPPSKELAQQFASL